MDLMVARLADQLAGQGIGLELTDAVKVQLAEQGYDPSMGARPLRRAIQRLVEDPLSERLLHKEFSAGEIVVVDVEETPDDLDAPGGHTVVFRGIAGFEPPTVEMAVEGAE